MRDHDLRARVVHLVRDLALSIRRIHRARDRAELAAGIERDLVLRTVRKVQRHPIAGGETERRQAVGERFDSRSNTPNVIGSSLNVIAARSGYRAAVARITSCSGPPG